MCCADSYSYSLERNDCILRVRVAFSVKLSNDVFPELPTRCCFSQGVFGAVEYCCIESDLLYLTDCGHKIYTKQAARRKAANTLHNYAEWLEISGMSSILILQGKL